MKNKNIQVGTILDTFGTKSTVQSIQVVHDDDGYTPMITTKSASGVIVTVDLSEILFNIDAEYTEVKNMKEKSVK